MIVKMLINLIGKKFILKNGFTDLFLAFMPNSFKLPEISSKDINFEQITLFCEWFSFNNDS